MHSKKTEDGKALMWHSPPDPKPPSSRQTQSPSAMTAVDLMMVFLGFEKG
jgi:hypothetical protein